MTNSGKAADRLLLDAFENCTLPYAEWDHRAHVRVGYLYVSRMGFSEALDLLRARIKAYNRAHADQVRFGYHETITVAFLALISASLDDSGWTGDSEGFCERHAELLSPALLRRHYSEELLTSDRARYEWVRPDLQPLTDGRDTSGEWLTRLHENKVTIDDFVPEDVGAFEALNLEWIRAHFQAETQDLETLRDPQGKVLAPGGHIHMARLNGEPIGTVALIPMGDHRFELAKMAVSPRAQGLGIGERLGLAALETARRLGARRVFLESNTKLLPALRLYQKLGFQEVEAGPASPYARCDIQMEVELG